MQKNLKTKFFNTGAFWGLKIKMFMGCLCDHKNYKKNCSFTHTEYVGSLPYDWSTLRKKQIENLSN